MSMLEVDTKGFAQLQAGREPWRLAKELVSNAFDEREVKNVEVLVESVFKGPVTNSPAVIIVGDDGPGFRDIKDAYTLYAWTYKREDPTTRGRFNLGEKEIIALAQQGEIRTTSGTVYFNGDSKKVDTKARTKRGTIVKLVMGWTPKDIEDIVQKLRQLVPPSDKTYTVNGVVVPKRKAIYEVEATLETILLSQDGLMRPTRRKTIISVYQTLSGETPMLFEMGIPVQELDKQEVPWHLDVQQKIPLAPNRDSVRPAYLQDVLAETLNATAKDLSVEEASATWVKEAIGDERVSNAAAKQVFDTRFEGKAMVGNPLDSLAMERAMQAGMTIIHPRSLTAGERARLKETGAIKNVSEVYGLSVEGEAKPYKPTESMLKVAKLVHRLAPEVVGHDVRVAFVTLPRSYGDAYCGTGTLTFVINKLGKEWFDHIHDDMLGLIIHELTHEIAKNDLMPHGIEFVRKMGDIAGQVVLLMQDQPKLFKL